MTARIIIIKMTCILLFSVLNSCGDSRKESGNAAESDSGNEETLLQEAMLTSTQFKTLQLKVDTLQRQTMYSYVEVNGQLDVPPQNEAAITTSIGANVVSIVVIEGDEVSRGETVAYLSHPNIVQIQTDYLNAHSESEYLKKEYERQKKLYDAGVGSGSNFQKAEATHQAANSRSRGLEAQLQQLGINTVGVQEGNIQQRIPLRSPIGGFVQNVKVKTGQYVEPQTDLFEVVDTNHIHADLMVFEKDIYKLKTGQTVSFKVQSIPGKQLSAEIYSIGKTFEQQPKAVHVHAEIANKEGNLIPGMYIEGRILTDSLPATVFPEEAIAQDGTRSFVFTAEREGEGWSFKPIEVVIGNQDKGWVAVNFSSPPAEETEFAYNNAYYLMGEMKKGSATHDH